MPSMWLPNDAADALIGEAEARRVIGDGGFRDRLKAIDSRLSVFLCDTPVDHQEAEFQQGYWYITRRNENGTVTCWQISDELGRPTEPSEAHLEAFRRGDANRTDLKHERATELERRRQAKEKRKQDRREEQMGQVKELADFMFRQQTPIKRAP